MILQHRRAGLVELVLERRHDTGMIVSNVVNAISGIEIQNNSSVRGMKLGSATMHVLDVHLQDVKQPYPLWIDVTLVEIRSAIVDADRLQQGNLLSHPASENWRRPSTDSTAGTASGSPSRPAHHRGSRQDAETEG